MAIRPHSKYTNISEVEIYCIETSIEKEKIDSCKNNFETYSELCGKSVCLDCSTTAKDIHKPKKNDVQFTLVFQKNTGKKTNTHIILTH